MEHIVKLDRFEGPYSKLLEMIEARKLSITELSLASIAEEYVAYVRSLATKDYQDVSQFIIVASTLMLIKVKSLLPGIDFTDEEEKQTKGLEKKLVLFATLEETSKHIRHMWGKHKFFFKKETLSQESFFLPAVSMTRENLFIQAEAMLFTVRKKELLQKIVVPQLIRMEEVIERMIMHVQDKMSLRELSLSLGIEETRKALLMGFLALLELIRLGSLDAEQDVDGEIVLIVRNGE